MCDQRFDLEVQYVGEQSWHYYGTVDTYEEAQQWVQQLTEEKPGRTNNFRIRQDAA